MKNEKNSLSKEQLQKYLPMILCVVGFITALVLPFNRIYLGMIGDTTPVGLKFLFGCSEYFNNPYFQGNLGKTLVIVEWVVYIVLLLSILLAIFGCIKNKKKCYTTGIGLATVSLVACFVLSVMIPYYVPNSLERKAYLFTEIGRSFRGLSWGFWLTALCLFVSGLIVGKRDRK